ncbi:hypothetical protein L1987_85073 [Smallanthus sonchifolius]|uniref:Uncharacterized protein n=1 Tax=Smallanthus sonchifolius TaxID=185202 RepID=A0ACB8XW59_9ASTR|nr:hypothetical protein L1987_85073 [Smallanthus sonchifolius]
MGSQQEHTTQRYLQRANTHTSGDLDSTERNHGQCHMVVCELVNEVSEKSDWSASRYRQLYNLRGRWCQQSRRSHMAKFRLYDRHFTSRNEAWQEFSHGD